MHTHRSSGPWSLFWPKGDGACVCVDGMWSERDAIAHMYVCVCVYIFYIIYMDGVCGAGGMR